MKIYLMELHRIFKRNILTPLFTLISFFCVIMLVGLSMSYYFATDVYKSSLEEGYGNKSFYKISWDIDTRQLLENLGAPEMVLKQRDAIIALDSADSFELHTSRVEQLSFLKTANVRYKDEWLSGYENGFTIPEISSTIALKSILADRYFWENPFVKLESGRVFNDEEYLLDTLAGNIVPVVLGHEYNEYYQIGDTMESLLLECETILLVVGFLERDSYFYDNNNRRWLLNRYIVTPYHDLTYTPVLEGEDTDYFYRGTYMSRLMNARIVCDTTNAQRAVERANSILAYYGLYDFKLFDESGGAQRGYVESVQISNFALTFTAILIIISSAALILAVFNKVYREIKSYSIYRLIGMSKRAIYLMSVFDTVITVIIANIFAFAFAYLMKSNFSTNIMDAPIMVVVFTIEVVVLAVSLLIIRYKIYNTDLSSVIRGKE